MSSTEILFYHGWAYDADFWKQKVDPKFNVSFFDRGYFAHPNEELSFSSLAMRKVIVAHSLGLHFVPEKLLHEADQILCFGCFSHFHPLDKFREKLSRRTLNLMCKQFEKDPQRVLETFWLNAGSKSLERRKWNLETLWEDLKYLDTSFRDFSAFKGKVKCFYGLNDRILERGSAENLAKQTASTLLVKVDDKEHVPQTISFLSPDDSLGALESTNKSSGLIL